MDSDICKPNTNTRRTAKVWLKTYAKSKAAEMEKTKSPVLETTPVNEFQSFETSAIKDTAAESTVTAEADLVQQLPNDDDVELPDAVTSNTHESLDVRFGLSNPLTPSLTL
jgi:hypothetical protein